MKGFLGDAVRLYWAAVYWNIRKTMFRLRRGRGSCPCQHASDSGLANETACLAITHWQKPARFQRVCPLLKQRPDGIWRCSVNSAEVRPFWMRACLLYAGTLVALAVAAMLSCYGVMRQVGYQVTFRQIAWPPAWAELNQVRSDYFLQKAEADNAAGHVRESLLALFNAYELNPANYAAGLRLAQLWQVNQSAQSNAVFERLMQDHPAMRTDTARIWLRALLARADYAGMQHLAANRLRHEPTVNPAWLHAFVFANERTSDTAFFNDLLADPGLPSATREILRLIGETRGLPPAEQRAQLIQAYLQKTPDAYTAFYIGRRLIQIGHPDEALALTLRADSPLADRERILLRLDSLAALNRHEDRNAMFARLLGAEQLNDTVAELLCAHLIRHPDTALAAALIGRSDVPGAPPLRYETHLALFCLAGVLGDGALLDAAAQSVRRAGGGSFTTLDTVRRYFLKQPPDRRIENVLPILQPLPLEISYALLETRSAP